MSGTAQAGSAAIARDAQTAFLNPAGMTRLEAPEFLFTAQPFLLQFDFNRSSATTTPGSSGGDQGDWFPGGAMYLAIPFGERGAVGFSMTAPAGLGLDPGKNWAGRYFMTEVELIVINLEPSIGIPLNDEWSVGGGIDFQYAKFDQDIAVNRPGPLADGQATVDGDSWDIGFSLSVLWEPLDTTRFGLRYRSEVNHDLTGDLTAFTAAPVSSSLDMPQNLTVSAYHEFTESFALMADVGWYDWSTFDRTIISIDGLLGTQVEIPRNFDDTWTVSLGAHVKTAEDWLLMFGAGYTSSAVDDSDRTPDMPVDEQIRLSVGFEHQLNATWKVGGNYTFIWLGDNDLDASLNPSTGRIVGDYDSYAHLFGIYASVQF